MTNRPTPFPKRRATDVDRRRLRGTLWQCPYCRQGYPLADVGDQLIPVQLVIAKGYTPIGNVVGPDGAPLQLDIQKLTKTNTFRPVPVVLPHILVCIPAMRARNIKPELYQGVIMEPPGLVTPKGEPTNGEP